MPIIASAKPLKARRKHDFYPTHSEVCDATLSLLPPDFKPTRVLEPGAGEAPFLRAAKKRYPDCQTVGVDIRNVVKPDHADLWYPRRDFVTMVKNREQLDAPDLGKFDLIVTNPPFNIAEKIALESLKNLLNPDGFMLFLLRFTWRGSKGRQKLFEEYPLSRVSVLVPRPSFMGEESNETDADEYAIFQWGGAAGGTILDALKWDRIKRVRKVKNNIIATDEEITPVQSGLWGDHVDQE